MLCYANAAALGVQINNEKKNKKQKIASCLLKFLYVLLVCRYIFSITNLSINSTVSINANCFTATDDF